MISIHFFSQLGLIALVWLYFLRHRNWPGAAADACPTTPRASPSRHTAMPANWTALLAYTPPQPYHL